MILANFNVDCNIAQCCFTRLASNLRQIGDWSKIENPETIAVSGFLKFLMRSRLSLGVFGVPFISCNIVENRLYCAVLFCQN